MKILLTGALGFIGRNFILYRPKNWQIFALDINSDKEFQKLTYKTKYFKIDLTDEIAVKRLTKKMPKFDVCLHLAANSDPALSIPEPAWDLKSTTLTLINVCQNFHFDKIIYLSSGAVYDGHQGLINPKIIIDPVLPYAISHLTAERYSRFFSQDKEYIVIRFFGAYGPFEPPRKIYTNLVKNFGLRPLKNLPKCHFEHSNSHSEADDMSAEESLANARSRTSREILRLTAQDDIEKKKDFVIRGDGKNFIDAMDVEDAVRGLVAVIKSKKANLTIDFCKGDHPTINQLVEKAARVFNINVKIKHKGTVPEYNNFYASPEKFAEIFHFKPEISLQEGLEKLKEHLNMNKRQ